jgi:lysozyme
MGVFSELGIWTIGRLGACIAHPVDPVDCGSNTMSANALDVSNDGLATITFFEGMVLKSYKDAVGIWTVGIGHTAAAGPPIPRADLTITKEAAFNVLRGDCKITDEGIERLVRTDLEQYEFDALMSLTINIGVGGFGKSSVLRHLNAGNRLAAADSMLLWDKAGGRVLKGLTRRREKERNLFLTGIYPAIWDLTTTIPVDQGGTNPVMSSILLKKGVDAIKAVKALQTNLNALKAEPKLVVDGDFGDKTYDAVVAFQKTHSLKVDGKAGVATRTAILRAMTVRGLRQQAQETHLLPGQRVDAILA